VKHKKKYNDRLIDGVKVLRLIQHKIGYFGDFLRSQSLGVVLKKKTNKIKASNTRTTYYSKLKQKNT